MMESPALNRASLGSPYAVQLEAGFGQLKFSGLLEKEFREYYADQNLGRARLAGVMALILVLALTCIDLALGTSAVSDRVNALRVGVLCPVLVLMIVGGYLPSVRAYFTPLVGVGVVVIGVVVTYICHVSALHGASYVLAGVVLVNLYATLLLGLLFPVAVAAAGVLMCAHVALGLFVGQPLDELLYVTAILTAASVIGAITAYNLEHAHRTSFLEMRLLNELAERDGLTGLYNRRMFDDLIRRLWRQSRRDAEPLAVIFVDIDYFKIYNDMYGHQAGDDCLRRVAQAIMSSAKRPFDFCARYGGEEFVLVVYGAPAEHTRALSEQIRERVLALGIPHAGSEVGDSVTVSVGVGLTGPGTRRSLSGAIQTADEALYEAKQQGRDRVVFRDAAEIAVETGNFRAAFREAG